MKKIYLYNEFVSEGDCKCGGNCTCTTTTTTTTTNEANTDGTISDDEDEEMEGLLADVRFMTEELIDHINKEIKRIGGSFRAPGYEYQCKKLIKQIMLKKKFKL
jgi:hypothetical protein